MLETTKLVDTNNSFLYQDILYLEHPNPRRHPRQCASLRAGQFSPFAALNGYDEQLEEVSRYTISEMFLTDSEKDLLDEKLQLIQQNKELRVKITYFKKDLKKKGGEYRIKIGKLQSVDFIHHLLLFQDKMKISVKDIVKIEIIESPD